MNWNKAFDIVLKEFGISAKSLSELTGISRQTISRFRNGHSPMTTDNLDNIVKVLPFEARQRFFALILGNEVPTNQLPPIEEQISHLSKDSRKKLVITIIDSLTQEPAELSKTA